MSGRWFGLGAGLAVEAGGVLRADFPVGMTGGDAVRGLVGAGLQDVQAGGPVAGLMVSRERF